MLYVVGSGPAGLSCARALLARGSQVTMLDAGLDLEPDRATLVKRLATTTPEHWSDGDLERLREQHASTRSGIPRKHLYGSLFPYRQTGDETLVEDIEQIGAVPSYARGGFSNVWGAGALPYADEEIVDWPITAADLAPHFRAVLEAMPLAATSDGLEDVFPLHTENAELLTPSRQAESFLEDLRHHRDQLAANGFTFGRSRLAVQVGPGEGLTGCVYCGLCLYGCPYRLIYNTISGIEALRANSSFRYQPGVTVDRVDESLNSVVLLGRRSNGESCAFSGKRAFLACGSLSTTRIALASLRASGESVCLKDSQYFLLPLLRYRGTPGVEAEHLHTLCQIFLRLQAANLGRHAAHLSVYTYNDLYARIASTMLGPAAPLARIGIRPLVGRLLAVQGHLHSENSSLIRVTLDDADRVPPRIRVSVDRLLPPRRAVKWINREMWRCRHLLKAIPVTPFGKLGKPGAGYYAGGSLPMRRDPGRFECDPLGRPSGFARLHLVDAAVFPSIAGTPITLTVMANAHRIGSKADVF